MTTTPTEPCALPKDMDELKSLVAQTVTEQLAEAAKRDNTELILSKVIEQIGGLINVMKSIEQRVVQQERQVASLSAQLQALQQTQVSANKGAKEW